MISYLKSGSSEKFLRATLIIEGVLVKGRVGMNVLKIVRKVFFIVINIVLGTLFWLIISENNYDFLNLSGY